MFLFIHRKKAGLDDFEHFHVFHGYHDRVVYSVVRTASELLGNSLINSSP